MRAAEDWKARGYQERPNRLHTQYAGPVFRIRLARGQIQFPSGFSKQAEACDQTAKRPVWSRAWNPEDSEWTE